MAFNYENPHDDPNLGNYDYYVNEVKDFQRKLDEYQESVDQKLADQDADIANLQNQVNGQINGLRNEVRDFEARITDEVDSINEHTETYVNNYLEENINTILQDNPVLETKYERVGTIPTGETLTYNLTANKMYEIVYLDYEFNYTKYLVSNNTYRKIAQTYTNVPTTIENSITHEVLICSIPVILADSIGETIDVSLDNLVFSITNNKPNTLTVYVKELI